MNYGKIYKSSILDGPGVRVSLYVSGCRNHCPGCHNPESWDFNFGQKFTEKETAQLLELLSRPYIAGLSLVGGEPFEEENQSVLGPLVQLVKTQYPEKNIWCWTGYELEDLLPGGRKHSSDTDQMLQNIDALVVGRFDLSQRDISDENRWRGSRNQRVVDLPQTLQQGSPVYLSGIPNND